MKKDKLLKELTLTNSKTGETVNFRITNEIMQKYNKIKKIKKWPLEQYLWVQYYYGKKEETI
jgi:hypothetical protein|nr:MAG TPA: hypothetical protein [Caudoviricetes sp.]